MSHACNMCERRREELELRAKNAEYLVATLTCANERLRSGLAALQAMANEVTEFAAEVGAESSRDEQEKENG